VGQTLALLGAPDPRLDPSGRIDLRLSRQLRSYHRHDPPPQRMQPISLDVLRHVMSSVFQDHHAPWSLQAAADLISIGFFFLMRPGESFLAFLSCVSVTVLIQCPLCPRELAHQRKPKIKCTTSPRRGQVSRIHRLKWNPLEPGSIESQAKGRTAPKSACCWRAGEDEAKTRQNNNTSASVRTLASLRTQRANSRHPRKRIIFHRVTAYRLAQPPTQAPLPRA
jgi:hypothetical protein